MRVVIHYIGHSGFCVEMPRATMVFDYYTGSEPIDQLKGAQNAYIFASHSHGDHYNRSILSWKKINPEVQYIFSDDIVESIQHVSMAPLSEYSDNIIKIFTLKSTDLGVAFDIETEGRRIFFAGDLNLWDWAEESTEQEIIQAKEDYLDAIEPVEGRDYDIIFFPIDPRMGKDYFEGAKDFVSKHSCKYFVPMHFGKRYEALTPFLKWASEHHPDMKVLNITRQGEKFSLEL